MHMVFRLTTQIFQVMQNNKNTFKKYRHLHFIVIFRVIKKSLFSNKFKVIEETKT